MATIGSFSGRTAQLGSKLSQPGNIVLGLGAGGLPRGLPGIVEAASPPVPRRDEAGEVRP